jgi:hypothetical protein
MLNEKLLEKIKTPYQSIFDWHKRFGVQMYEMTLGSEFYNSRWANYYKDIINFSLVSPENATVEHIAYIALETISGKLSWAALQQINGKTLLSLAYIILNEKDNFKVSTEEIDEDSEWEKSVYEEKAEENYISEPELNEIVVKDFESKNIGGINVAIQCNQEQNNSENPDKYTFASPLILGFQKNEKQDTLVNLAKNDIVRISEIVLTSHGESNQMSDYKVKFKVKNLTRRKLTFNLPKGQVFENKSLEYTTQNLAVAKNYEFSLNASEEKEFSVFGYCMNRSFGSPENVPANITIYCVRDIDKWHNQDEIWDYFGNNSIN